MPVPENYFPELKTLLQAAVQQSPRMIARHTDEAIVAGQRAITRADQLPRLGGRWNYLPLTYEERVGDPRSPYTSQKSAYALEFTQPLYHWGALHDATKMADLARHIAQGQTAETYRALVGEIRAGYLQLIVKKASLARTRTGLQFAEESLALAQERFERGEIPQAEFSSMRLGVEQARLNADRAVDDYASSKRTYARLYGGEPLSDEQIADAVPDVAVELAELEDMLAEFGQQKEQRSYGLRNLRDQIQMERLNYDIANKRLRPKLGFLAGTSQDEQSYTRNIGERYGVTAYYAGVRVEWAIFDGFATRAIKQNSLIRRRQQERDYRQLSDDLLENAKARLRQAQFSARSLELSRQFLRVSEENLNRARDNVSRGLAPQSDLRTAEFNHAGSLIDAYNARIDCLMRATDFIATILADPALANLPAQYR